MFSTDVVLIEISGRQEYVNTLNQYSQFKMSIVQVQAQFLVAIVYTRTPCIEVNFSQYVLFILFDRSPRCHILLGCHKEYEIFVFLLAFNTM